jgi:hypothetical protein
MRVFGGKWPAVCAAGISAVTIGGCVNHDQLYLANPSPCHITCEADHVALIDPECHGYHPTCWTPWSCNCAPGGIAPQPYSGVGVPPPQYFEMPGGTPAQNSALEAIPTPAPTPFSGPFPAPNSIPTPGPTVPNPIREMPSPAPSGAMVPNDSPAAAPENRPPNSATDPRALPQPTEKSWAGRLFSFLGRRD